MIVPSVGTNRSPSNSILFNLQSFLSFPLSYFDSMGQCLQSPPATLTHPNNQHQNTNKDTHLIHNNDNSIDSVELKPCKCSDPKCQNRHNKHIQKYRCKKCNGSGYIEVTRCYGFPWYRHEKHTLHSEQ